MAWLTYDVVKLWLWIRIRHHESSQETCRLFWFLLGTTASPSASMSPHVMCVTLPSFFTTCISFPLCLAHSCPAKSRAWLCSLELGILQCGVIRQSLQAKVHLNLKNMSLHKRRKWERCYWIQILPPSCYY